MVGRPLPKEEIVMYMETGRQGDRESKTYVCKLLNRESGIVLNSLNSLSPCLLKILL